jgi:hypothetical protein
MLNKELDGITSRYGELVLAALRRNLILDSTATEHRTTTSVPPLPIFKHGYCLSVNVFGLKASNTIAWTYFSEGRDADFQARQWCTMVPQTRMQRPTSVQGDRIPYQV